MTQIPKSLPVHPRSRQRLHELRVRDLSGFYSSARRQLYETLQCYLEYPTDAIEEQMNSLITSYQKLCTLQESSEKLSARLENVKQSFRSSSDQCEAVDPITWYRYASGELTGPTKLSDLFKEEQDTSRSTSRGSTEDLLLGALKYIWKDPTAVIPDEQKDEDDLYIEGGKIELHCPITYKTFEKPMISKKCNHVFDRVGIESYLKDATSRDCPQSGCSQKLTMNDFQEDDLMKLRCRIAKLKKDVPKAESALDVI